MKYLAKLTYEVVLGGPEFANRVNDGKPAWKNNVPVSHEDIEASWHEAESDIVYAATAAYDVGDLEGIVFWGTDFDGKWVATTDKDYSISDIRVTYGLVTYEVEFTAWNYEGME